jgi:hypothetical protein
MGNLCSSSLRHPNRVGGLGLFRLPRRLSLRPRSGTVRSQSSPFCEMARHDSLSLVKTQCQSSPVYVCARHDTVSVQSEHGVIPVLCVCVRACVCARARARDTTHSQSSQNTLSLQSCMCARDATHSQSSPLCVCATRHCLSSARTHSHSSPVYVRARRDTVQSCTCVRDTTQSQFSLAHSLSPVLYVCELTFSFPSSKESRLTEQALSRLVTIYKPHNHVTTHLLFIYICTYIYVNITKYPLNMKKRVVSERASTPIQGYWYYHVRQHIAHSRSECQRGSE